MWGKIASVAKKFAVDKAKNAVKDKAIEEVNTKGIGKVLATMGMAGVAAVAVVPIAVILLLIAPLLVIHQSFSSIFIIQGLDKAYADTGNENNGEGGKILLIAGHSYKPYCEQVPNECREEGDSTPAGYSEPDETRSLVKLIRSELSSLGASVDIANELLAPGDSKMNTSFYAEKKMNTEKFNSIDWSKYSYVLEVHFNAGGGSGPLLVKSASSYSTAADAGIIDAVTSNLGTSQQGDSIQDITSISYFNDLNIPITYLETEFYDNKSAMDNYTSHKNQVAKDIAQVIYDTYGKISNTRAAIVERAKAEIGKPYAWGAVGPDSYDCSGLVGYALTGEHVRIGTTLTYWGWPETSNPQPGDIAVIDDGSGNGHTGLYIGDGQMVHAPNFGIPVQIGPVQSGMKYVVYPDLAG